MIDLTEAQSGDVLTASRVNEIVNGLRASSIMPTGLSRTTATSGTTLNSLPTLPVPVFLVRATDDDFLLGKQALLFSSGAEGEKRWDVFSADDDSVLIRGRPWPGYTVSDFAPFFLADPANVSEGEIAVEYRAGFYFPPASAQSAFKWVYLVGTEGSMLVGKEAAGPPNPPFIAEGAERIVAPPAPGYTLSHFQFDIVNENSITASARVAIYAGGHFLPDRRMKLVRPLDVSEFCEPCVPQQDGTSAARFAANATRRAAGNCEGCGGG